MSSPAGSGTDLLRGDSIDEVPMPLVDRMIRWCVALGLAGCWPGCPSHSSALLPLLPSPL